MDKKNHTEEISLRDNTQLEKSIYDALIEAGLIIPQTEEDICRAEKALEKFDCPPLPPELSDPYLIINELDEWQEDAEVGGAPAKNQPLKLIHSIRDENHANIPLISKPYLGYVSDETGEPPSAITQAIGTSRQFLILVSQNSDSVDDCVRDEIADRTVKKWPQLNRNRILTSLTISSGRIAASRNKPYSAGALSFEQILDRSGLGDEEREYWRKLGERHDALGFLKYARQRARGCRDVIGASTENLLGRVEKYLWDTYRIELCDVDASEIDDSRAEVHPDQNSLLYDRRLLENPDQLLYYVAHELGHMELHSRLAEHDSRPDPVYGSVYNNSGPNSLTRYNPRSKEEAEANAFAAEFLCPSDEVFHLWRSDSALVTAELAKRMGAPSFVVRAQLAEAVYQYTYTSGLNKSQPPKKEFICDTSQESAATFTGRPVLVDAGPGTGKTATLIRRIQFVLEELKAKPESLLVLTFSNEAAAELGERIGARFGKALAARINVSTFHGFGLSILQLHGQFQNVDANACVLDEAGQTELVTNVIGKVSCHEILKLSKPQDTVQEVVKHIEFLKDRLYTPDLFEQALDAWKCEQGEVEKARVFLKIFRAYESAKAKEESQRLDFADLILKPIELLRKESRVKNAYREKYEWVMVDEYQDVSRATAILLQQICGEENPPWVVGDKRQSIFRFRGAAPENVDEFENDFPGAVKFTLGINYRSCTEVISTANRLADLMKAGSDVRPTNPLWQTAPSNPQGFGERVVSVAVADSDRSEQEGISQQIKQWLAAGVNRNDIAVLARRNVDVRNIVLSLGELEIKATTSGLVTAEGAAGDLVNIVTFVDRPTASLPRLAFSLGRGRFRRFGAETINAAVRHLRDSLEASGTFDESGIVEGRDLIFEIKRLYECLQREDFTGDAFAMICAFLFDGSDYLRRVLDLTDEVEKSLALSEIVTTLAQASAYRLSHLDLPAKVSRKGFAKFFRESLSSSAPCLTPPKAEVEAVKVMTCHAAKGLEFPFVVVAGQARSTRLRNRGGYRWLPPDLEPKDEEDEEQADSVLFVGATRAQRALVISYAATSSGLPKAEKRAVTPLLNAWCEQPDIQPTYWPSAIAEKEYVEVGPIWGGTLGQPLSARSLDKGYCSLNTYLRDYSGIKFPVNEKPLYPIFYTTVRYVMQTIVELANSRKLQVDDPTAEQILLDGWEKSVDPTHPHHDLYYHVARTYAGKFARGYLPEEGHVEYLNPTAYESRTQFPVRLDLVSLYRVNGGAPTAILFRPESLRERNRETGLLWGALTPPSRRIAFVLLRQIEPALRPIVFSGEDGVFYNYLWSTRKTDFANEVERVNDRFKSFARGYFAEEVIPFTCDKCESRVACPHWLKALA